MRGYRFGLHAVVRPTHVSQPQRRTPERGASTIALPLTHSKRSIALILDICSMLTTRVPARWRLQPPEITLVSLRSPARARTVSQRCRPARQWPRERVALDQFAVQAGERGPGVVVLDALGDDAHAEAVGEAERRAHDRLGGRVAAHLGDEGAVDLDLVDGQRAEVRSRITAPGSTPCWPRAAVTSSGKSASGRSVKVTLTAMCTSCPASRQRRQAASASLITVIVVEDRPDDVAGGAEHQPNRERRPGVAAVAHADRAAGHQRRRGHVDGRPPPRMNASTVAPPSPRTTCATPSAMIAIATASMLLNSRRPLRASVVQGDRYAPASFTEPIIAPLHRLRQVVLLKTPCGHYGRARAASAFP